MGGYPKTETFPAVCILPSLQLPKEEPGRSCLLGLMTYKRQGPCSESGITLAAGIQPGLSCMLGKYSATQLPPDFSLKH